MEKKYNGFRGSFYLDSSGECVGRTCSKCHIAKPKSDYGRSSKNRFGLFNMCFDCSRSSTPKSKRSITIRNRRKRNNLRTNDEIINDRKRLRVDGTKRCRQCKVNKLFSEFYSDRGITDGLSTRCSSCTKQNNIVYKTEPHLVFWKSKGIPIECYVCGDIENLHIDHVIPRKLGGSDDSHNRLPLCALHNLSKNVRTLNNWLLEFHPDKYDEVMHRVIVEYQVWPFVKDHDLVITIDR